MDSMGREGHIPERHEHGSEKTLMLRRFAKEGMALQTVGTHGLAELIRRIEQKLPLDLTPEQIHSFIELGCLLERQARAEDNVGDEN